jgi:hypothetical protein
MREITMNKVQAVEKQEKKTSQKIFDKNTEEMKYSVLSKEDAIVMTSEVIEKYRPALEKLAE